MLVGNGVIRLDVDPMVILFLFFSHLSGRVFIVVSFNLVWGRAFLLSFVEHDTLLHGDGDVGIIYHLSL